MLIAERLAELEQITLLRGSHEADHQFCAMELAAYLAGEPHTDHPACVSPVLGAFLRQWNDDLDDAGRQKLKPYIPRVIGTAGNTTADEQRAWLVTDWMVRVHTPAWLELAGLKTQAESLRGLPPILSGTVARANQPALEGARKDAAAARAAAWDAARAAAGAAARDAARDAARAAARAAAWDAAWAAAWDAARAAAWDAARAAARAAAWDAAWDAAWAAAWDAAWAALQPTGVSLKASAFDLLDRLIVCDGQPK